MATMSTEKVIGLWYDVHSKPGHPAWIVSRDRMDDAGGAVTTDTLAVFGPDDYAGAKAEAVRMAALDGTRVIQTEADGSQRCVFAAPKKVDVMRHSDGEKVGTTRIDAADWARYEAADHPAYQWPEGVARADDVLSDDEIEAMGIDGSTVIFLD